MSAVHHGLLQLLKRMKPVIVAFAEDEMEASGDCFLQRFQACLDSHWVHSHVLDAMLGPRDVRLVLPWEGTWFRLHTISIIACEGPDRLVRPLSKAKWHEWFRSWGFHSLPVSQPVLEGVERVLLDYNGFSSSYDGTAVWLCFQGRRMLHATCWAPAEALPPSSLQAPLAEPGGTTPLCSE